MPADLLQDIGRHLRVLRRGEAFLGLLQVRLQRIARQAEHDAAIRAQEPPVGVEGETPVPAALRKSQDGPVVQSQVENGLHHPGHGARRPRSHRHQQRIALIPESAPDDVLEARDAALKLPGEGASESLATALQVQLAHVGADDEPRGHWQADARHLHESRPLAAQTLAQAAVAFRPAPAEEIDRFGRHQPPDSPGFGPDVARREGVAAGSPATTISEKSPTRRNRRARACRRPRRFSRRRASSAITRTLSKKRSRAGLSRAISRSACRWSARACDASMAGMAARSPRSRARSASSFR